MNVILLLVYNRYLYGGIDKIPQQNNDPVRNDDKVFLNVNVQEYIMDIMDIMDYSVDKRLDNRCNCREIRFEWLFDLEELELSRFELLLLMFRHCRVKFD
jgi:hypothetical protein